MTTTSGETRAAVHAPAEATLRSVARSSATVAAWTLVSRVTGLLRIVVIGAVLGPTFLANTFLATNQVPNLTYSVVAGPVLALVVVPAVVQALLERGPVACALHVRRLSGLLLAASSTIAALLVPVSLAVGWVLTLGVPEADRGRARGIAVLLLVLVAPQVMLYTVAALGAAAQQARERYALAAAAPALENVGLMATMLAVAVLFRPGTDIADVEVGMVFLLGGGATLSVAVHAVVQAVGAARAGLPLWPEGRWRRDAEVRAVARRLRAAVMVAALPTAGTFLLLAVAASMRGGVVVFQMAYLVYGVPTALGARAVTTAVLPRMTAAAQRADTGRYAAAWRQALTYAATTGLPAMCVLAVFAGAVAGALSTGELRDDASMTSLATCVAIMAVAQLASGVHEIGRQALFARLDGRGPQISGLVSFAVTAVAGAAALLLPAGTPRLAGLCAALLLADLAAAGTVVGLVRRSIRPHGAVDGRRLRDAAAAAAAMLPVLVVGRLLTDERGWWQETGGMAVTAALAAGVFALVVARLAGRSGWSA
jgi:putative peptidoglycan lipid II flippase